MDLNTTTAKETSQFLNKNLSPKKFVIKFQTKALTKRKLGLPQTLQKLNDDFLLNGGGLNVLHLQAKRYSNDPTGELGLESP